MSCMFSLLTDLVEPILGNKLEHNGLHGGDIAKPHLRDVESTYHMCPAT